MPDEFLSMSWVDWTRYAQGYLIRVCRNLESVRKIAYWQLLAAGAKNVKERNLFRLATDPPIVYQKVERITSEDLKKIDELLFGNKTGKAWQQNKG